MLSTVFDAYRTTIVCLGLAGGLLVFQLLVVDVAGIRRRHPPGLPIEPDPTDFLFRATRAHANTNESIAAFTLLAIFSVAVGADAAWTNGLDERPGGDLDRRPRGAHGLLLRRLGPRPVRELRALADRAAGSLRERDARALLRPIAESAHAITSRAPVSRICAQDREAIAMNIVSPRSVCPTPSDPSMVIIGPWNVPYT